MTKTRGALTALALAVTTAASWYGWLGWDHEYQIDPVTGIASGPYEAWQVVGCALTLLLGAVLAGVVANPWLPLVVVPPVFTVVWSLDAASQDETGLWAVGAVLVLIGATAGAAVVGVVATVLRARRARRARPTGAPSPA